MKKIKKCPECGVYSFRQKCKACGIATISPHPHKYSPEDRYGEYRRKQMDKYMKGED